MKALLITNSIEASNEYISQQIQSAWKTEVSKDNRKLNRNSKIEDVDKDIKIDIKIINSKEEINTFDSKYIPEIIYIIPELMWANDGVNEGYDIAKELITQKYKSEFIQFAFLSVLNRTTLAKVADARNKSMIEAFPHICLLSSTNEIKFNYYSKIHYNMIKHLAISNEGRLLKINHDMDSVKANIKNNPKNLNINKNVLLEKLNELILFQQWTDVGIENKIKNIKNINDNESLENELHVVEKMIDDIHIKLSKENKTSDNSLKTKSDYKMFIVEDSPFYKQFFYEIYTRFFSIVNPDDNNKYIFKNSNAVFEIKEADKIIKQIGQAYDIFLLDLLYKDENGYWLNFNGLDLYRLVKKVNPYAVIRIITSLPRGIVAKLIEVVINDTEKPSADQIFTKKYGTDALKDSIVENIDKLNAESRAKEKLKTAWAPFPQKGVFEWAGVKNYLHNSIFGSNTGFENTVENVQALFSSYLNKTLTKNSNNWDKGILPKPAQKDKQDNAVYIKEKLCSIMVHRLIVLNEALKKEEHRIFYSAYLDIIPSFTGIKSINKGYFQTKLGFRGSEYKKNNDITTHYFHLKLVNLFPHEKYFVSEKLIEKSNINENDHLTDFNPLLNNWFIRILCNLDTYENWDVLGLDFNPYSNQEDYINKGIAVNYEHFSNLTIKNLRDFLMAINMNYREVSVIGIVNYITDNPIAEDNINDNVIANLVNDIYKLDLDNDNE